MVIHKMKLSAVPFEKIASGRKTIESRLYDDKRQKINVGDRIEFVCENNFSEKVIVVVCALYVYPSFEKMFSDFPPYFFGGSSKGGLLEEIETFYTKEDQDKYGVVGIKVGLEK